MLVLAVLAEAFAVVADNDNQRRLIKGGAFQPAEKLADVGIGEFYFAVVAAPAMARRVGLGRRVRIVRIVKMDPGEKRTAPVCLQPSDRLANNLSRRKLPVRRGRAQLAVPGLGDRILRLRP